MQHARDYYPEIPEALAVNLARAGDRAAFEELVRRRQSAIRNLMRRCCNDAALADDLTQQVFLQVWLKIRKLREAQAFPAWLKKLAITTWLQHARKHDPLGESDQVDVAPGKPGDDASLARDLDGALATLATTVRTCVVLAYHEGMTHPEVAETTGLPLGTVKSHIRRGTEKLQQQLAAYKQAPASEVTP